MKIGIIGATGNVGSAILEEALRRNLDVTAIVRSPEKLKVKVPVIKRDLFDLTKEDLKGFDAIVDAFNAPEGKEAMHQSSLEHLIELLQGTSTRLLVVGGASSLFLDDAKTTRMIDEMPTDSPYYATAFNMYQAYETLKKAKNLIWTYVSPAKFFNPNGVKTGEYEVYDGVLQHNHAGKSEISTGDYAIGMVDIIEDKLYMNRHVGLVSK